MIYLLCCLRPRVHMELRKGRKRTLKVREMAEVEENGACEYLVGPRKQTDVESLKRSVKCEQWEWD